MILFGAPPVRTCVRSVAATESVLEYHLIWKICYWTVLNLVYIPRSRFHDETTNCMLCTAVRDAGTVPGRESSLTIQPGTSYYSCIPGVYSTAVRTPLMRPRLNFASRRPCLSMTEWITQCTQSMIGTLSWHACATDVLQLYSMCRNSVLEYTLRHACQDDGRTRTQEATAQQILSTCLSA